MAVSLTGSRVPLTGSTAQNPPAVDVTVPADATAIVVDWAGWDSGASFALSGSMTLDGVALTTLSNEAAVGDVGGYGRTWRAITGAEQSQTLSLDWAWTVAPSEGGCLVVSFLTSSGTVTVRDHLFNSTDAPSTTVSIAALSTNTTDLVLLGLAAYIANGAPDLAQTGQTVDDNNIATLNGYQFDIGHVDSPGVSTTSALGDGGFPSLVATSFYESSSGIDAEITAALGAISGAVTAAQETHATVVGALSAITGSITATQETHAAVAGSLGQLSGTVSASTETHAAISGALDAISGTIAASHEAGIDAEISGNLGDVLGTIVAVVTPRSDFALTAGVTKRVRLSYRSSPRRSGRGVSGRR